MWKNWLALLERVTILEMPLEMPEWCSLAGAKDIKRVPNQRWLYVHLFGGVVREMHELYSASRCAVIAVTLQLRCYPTCHSALFIYLHFFISNIKKFFFCFCKFYEIKVSTGVRKLGVGRGGVRRIWSATSMVSRAAHFLWWPAVFMCFCCCLSGAAELCAKPFCFAKLKSAAHQHGYNNEIPAEINTCVAMSTHIRTHTQSYLHIQTAWRGEV